MSTEITTTASTAVTTGRTWQECLAVFLDVRCKSPHTRVAYGRDLRHVFTNIGKTFLRDITPADLASHAARHLRPADGSAPRAQHARAMAAIKSFMKWAARPGVNLWPLTAAHVDDALELQKAPVRRPYQTLEEDELGALIRSARTERDRAAVTILFIGGLRVAEVAGLRIEDIQPQSNGGLRLHVVGKGGRARSVPLAPNVTPVIIEHLKKSHRSLRHRGPLFPNEAGEHLSVRRLQAVVSDTARRAGVHKRVSCHTGRHTSIMRWLRANLNTAEVQAISGHSSLAGLQVYVRHYHVSQIADKVPGLPEAS